MLVSVETRANFKAWSPDADGLAPDVLANCTISVDVSPAVVILEVVELCEVVRAWC